MHSDPEEQEFNFWPAFSDLMISVLLVLVLVVGTLQLRLRVADLSTTKVRRQQKELVGKFSSGGYRVRAIANDGEAVERASSGKAILFFSPDPNPFLQRVTFTEDLLFAKDHAELKPEGIAVLEVLSSSLSNAPVPIREIQIHGHADNQPSKRFHSNLELASARANSVFSYLVGQDEDHPNEHPLDPIRVLISSVSYGEYAPVDRRSNQSYSSREWIAANSSEAARALNRRVELLIFYSSVEKR